MKVNVSGSVEVGQSFTTYVEKEFQKEVDKYMNNVALVDVHAKKQSDKMFVSIIMSDVFKKGAKISAEAEDRDIYRAFNEAYKKANIQFLKEKDRFVSDKKKGKK